MSTGQREQSDVAVHTFLQLLAGWVPDQALAEARRTLADGKPAAAAAAAAAMVREHDVPLLAQDIDAAGSLAGEPGALDGVQPVPRYPRLPFWFSAFGPDERLKPDDLDRAMMDAAQAREAQIAGLWRSWRFPPDGFDEPDFSDEDENQDYLPDPDGEEDADDGDPADDLAAEEELRPSAAIDPEDPDRAHRVYVVQVPDGTSAPAVSGALHAVLAGRGEAGVEVIALETEPPPYQAGALAQSALLWAAPADLEPPFRLARVFDFANPETGPGFALGHRVIADASERDRILQYLRSGTAVLFSTARTKDILDPGAGQVVPTSFRTDGEWIWTDTVTYYLERYGLAPDEELAGHIDARWQAGSLVGETDHDTAMQAADFLLKPPPAHARKAVWTPGADD